MNGTQAGVKYDYEIAVDTGEILSSAYDEKHPDGVSAIAVTLLSVRQMQSRRHLAVSGATEKDIYEWEFDYDDGRPEYEGKIIYGGTEI